MTPRALRLRAALIGGLGLLAVSGMYFVKRIPQDPEYHNFADRRPFAGIPNFGDVVSNLPFCVVGAVAFLWFAKHRERVGFGKPFLTYHELRSWLVVFAGVFVTGLGSAYYHWAPDTPRLFWDRLPMTVAFMALLGVQVMERISVRGGSMLIVPFLVTGVSSVVAWRLGEGEGTGDLRLYALVQFYPLAAIPLMLLLYPARYNRSADLMLAFSMYVLAKVGEEWDLRIFNALGHTVSGHTIKHLFAATGTALMLRMLMKRRPLSGALPAPPTMLT
ncbi:MAG: alkaline phytoceramidase [Planctomycetota bacterium]